MIIVTELLRLKRYSASMTAGDLIKLYSSTIMVSGTRFSGGMSSRMRIHCFTCENNNCANVAAISALSRLPPKFTAKPIPCVLIMVFTSTVDCVDDSMGNKNGFLSSGVNLLETGFSIEIFCWGG